VNDQFVSTNPVYNSLMNVVVGTGEDTQYYYQARSNQGLVTITFELPFPVYLDHIKMYPHCVTRYGIVIL